MVQYKNLPNFPNLPQRRGRGGGKERGGWVGGWKRGQDFFSIFTSGLTHNVNLPCENRSSYHYYDIMHNTSLATETVGGTGFSISRP